MTYSHLSHTHCLSQEGNPPCGIPKEKHIQCCLCDLKYPTTLSERFNAEVFKPCGGYCGIAPNCFEPYHGHGDVRGKLLEFTFTEVSSALTRVKEQAEREKEKCLAHSETNSQPQDMCNNCWRIRGKNEALTNLISFINEQEKLIK